MYSWGKQEWKGAWSDGSPEWDAIPEKDRPENADDGSFWMSMDDFCEQFDALTITRTVNTAILSLERTWNCKSFKGRWEGEMAGGCKNEKDWLAHNPQFIIVQRKTSTVHVSLLQVGHSQREDMLVIGFSVFQIEENRRFRLISQNKIFPQAATKPEDATGHTNGEEAKGRKSSAKKMMKKLFKSDEDRAARKAGVRGCKSKYINSREVTVSARLRAGTYMIVPTTFKKGEVGDFLLRIYSNEPTEGQVAKSILERTSGKFCFRKPVQRHRGVVRATILCAANLPNRAGGIVTGEREPDPYVVLKVEKGTARSQGIRHYDPRTGTAARNPEWGVSFVFYVHDPATAQLQLEVRDDIPIFRDPLFGEVTVPLQQYTEPDRVEKSWDVTLPIVPRASPLNRVGSAKVTPGDLQEAAKQSTVTLRLCYTNEIDL